MHVPEIIEVKNHLAALKDNGLLLEWELPYENILTRRNAAIFFLTPADEKKMNEVADALAGYDQFSYRPNEEKKISQLAYRITFNQEEKEKNQKLLEQSVTETTTEAK